MDDELDVAIGPFHFPDGKPCITAVLSLHASSRSACRRFQRGHNTSARQFVARRMLAVRRGRFDLGFLRHKFSCGLLTVRYWLLAPIAAHLSWVGEAFAGPPLRRPSWAPHKHTSPRWAPTNADFPKSSPGCSARQKARPRVADTDRNLVLGPCSPSSKEAGPLIENKRHSLRYVWVLSIYCISHAGRTGRQIDGLAHCDLPSTHSCAAKSSPRQPATRHPRTPDQSGVGKPAERFRRRYADDGRLC